MVFSADVEPNSVGNQRVGSGSEVYDEEDFMTRE